MPAVSREQIRKTIHEHTAPAVSTIDVAATRAMAKEVFDDQWEDAKFFKESGFEAELKTFTDRASLEGLTAAEVKQILTEVRRHIAMQAHFSEHHKHEQQRSTYNPLTHIRLAWREMMVPLGGGLASSVRAAEVTALGNTAEVKMLLDTALDLQVMRHRLAKYEQLGGDEFRGVLEQFQKGEVTADVLLTVPDHSHGHAHPAPHPDPHHPAPAKKEPNEIYDKGLDHILDHAFDLKVGQTITLDGYGDVLLESEDTVKAIRHHLKFVLRSELIKLVSAKDLSVLSSDDFDVTQKVGVFGKLKEVGKLVMSSGTFWGIGASVGTKLALGGVFGAAFVSLPALGATIALGTAGGVVSAAVRERMNSGSRHKQRRMETAVGAEKKDSHGRGVVIEADHYIQSLAKDSKAIQTALLAVRTETDAAKRKKAIDDLTALIKHSYAEVASIEVRLARAKAKNQDYIAFGLDNRFQSQLQLLNTLEQSLELIQQALEALPHSAQHGLAHELSGSFREKVQELDLAQRVLDYNLAKEDQSRLTRSMVIGGLAGGLAAGVASTVIGWYSGTGEIAHGTTHASGEPSPEAAATATPDKVTVTPDAAVTTAVPTPGIGVVEQIFADSKVAHMLDAMGLQPGELQYDPIKKLFHIPDSAIHEVSGKAEYLGQTEGWRARRLEFILKAVAEHKGENPDLIVARAERATANLLLRGHEYTGNPQAAFDEAFHKSTGFIERNVLPWINGGRSHVSSRWMNLVNGLNEQNIHAVPGTPGASELAVSAGHGEATASLMQSGAEPAPEVAHMVSTLPDSTLAKAITEVSQHVGELTIGLLGGAAVEQGLKQYVVGWNPDMTADGASDGEHFELKQHGDDEDHKVEPAVLPDISEQAEKIKHERLHATAPERERNILGELTQFVVDADAKLVGQREPVAAFMTELEAAPAITVGHLTRLQALDSNFSAVRVVIAEAKAFLAKEKEGTLYKDIDHTKNRDALLNWTNSLEQTLDIEAKVKALADQQLQNVKSEALIVRKRADDERAPSLRRKELEEVLLPRLDFVVQLEHLPVGFIADTTWLATFVQEVKLTQAEINSAIDVIDVNTVLGQQPDVMAYTRAAFIDKGLLDGSDPTVPAAGKFTQFHAFADQVREFAKQADPLVAMGFRNTTMPKFADKHKKRIIAVVEAVAASSSKPFETAEPAIVVPEPVAAVPPLPRPEPARPTPVAVPDPAPVVTPEPTSRAAPLATEVGTGAPPDDEGVDADGL